MRLQHSYFRVNIAKLLKVRIHCEICLSDYLLKHNLMYISLNLIWKSPRTIIREKYHIPMFSTSPCCGHWLICFSWKDYFHGRLYQIILPEIKTGSFTIEFRYLSNKSIQNWCTLQDIYRQLFVNDKKVKRHFLEKQANTTKEYHVVPGKYVNIYKNTWFCQGALSLSSRL